ncbi:MAG: agmatine deiminase family protein, partial [Proteiniphilum sp.]|nr:agmatine deiminase family protein [Proteiniphilum sp.]
ATYANFLILNDAVLMPFYGTGKDEIARHQLQQAFPDREVVGVDCSVLILQHGSLHCATMQLPKGSLNVNSKFTVQGY